MLSTYPLAHAFTLELFRGRASQEERERKGVPPQESHQSG